MTYFKQDVALHRYCILLQIIACIIANFGTLDKLKACLCLLFLYTAKNILEWVTSQIKWKTLWSCKCKNMGIQASTLIKAYIFCFSFSCFRIKFISCAWKEKLISHNWRWLRQRESILYRNCIKRKHGWWCNSHSNKFDEWTRCVWLAAITRTI